MSDMQIKVPRNELFEQLPRPLRRAMVGESSIPEVFTFEVSNFEVGKFPKEQQIRKEFPVLFEVFTPIEWYMFCFLMTAEPNEVPYSVLGAKIKNNNSNPANSVNVHVKNMRIKLERLKMPLIIGTRRGGACGEGGHYIKRI